MIWVFWWVFFNCNFFFVCVCPVPEKPKIPPKPTQAQLSARRPTTTETVTTPTPPVVRILFESCSSKHFWSLTKEKTLFCSLGLTFEKREREGQRKERKKKETRERFSYASTVSIVLKEIWRAHRFFFCCVGCATREASSHVNCIGWHSFGSHLLVAKHSIRSCTKRKDEEGRKETNGERVDLF